MLSVSDIGRFVTPSISFDMSDEVYHAASDSNITAHGLQAYARCPEHFYRMKTGRVKDVDSPSYAFGRAAHTLILEGQDAFDRKYAVGGPINAKTGKPFGAATKAWAEWAAEHGKPVVGDGDLTKLMMMHAAVHGHHKAAAILGHGDAEVTLRTQRYELPAQSRIDWWARDINVIADLKTTRDIETFEDQITAYGYDRQMAFYRDMADSFRSSTHTVYLIAIEKAEPYRCGVWRLGDNLLNKAAQANARTAVALRDSIRDMHWPTRYEDVRVFDTHPC